MEHALVVDANVLVKLYLAEEFSDLAETLITSSLDDGRSLYGPLHLRSEVVNAIHKQWFDGHITAEEADQALTDFFQLPIILISSEELYQRAILFARGHRLRPVYDSLYAVLAEELGVEFWTNDQRFLRRVQSNAPWVRWLGDYHPI